MYGTLRLLIVIPLVLMLFACGGNDLLPKVDSQLPEVDPQLPKVDPPSSTVNRQLSGTVAVGAPVEATLTIIDREGDTLVVDSDAAGRYSINLEARPGPYLIRIEPKDSSLPVMYSYASGAGVANATPFTTLALVLAYQSSLTAAFSDWKIQADNWQRADLERALAMINANFNDELQAIAAVDPRRFDFFTTEFVADSSGIDAFLDAFTPEVDPATTTYLIRDSSGQRVAFDESVDTTGYYIGAGFVPADTALWELTWTMNTNGQGTPITLPVWLPNDEIPWRREQFDELYWDQLSQLGSSTVTDCSDDPRVSCNVVVTVSRLESDYDITGNGEVGTLITASVGYDWRISGWVKSGGIQQAIDQSYNWALSWRWERKS